MYRLINPLSPNFMKYCLDITHHMGKTSRRLKLLNVSEIFATTSSLVIYISESVKTFFLQPLLKVLVLIVRGLCDLSGILYEAYLSLKTAFSS